MRPLTKVCGKPLTSVDSQTHNQNYTIFIIFYYRIFYRKPYFSNRRYKAGRVSPSCRAVLAMLPRLAAKAC